jgi:hypothetical protein
MSIRPHHLPALHVTLGVGSTRVVDAPIARNPTAAAGRLRVVTMPGCSQLSDDARLDPEEFP